MNIVHMHNTIRTFLDEHQTARLTSWDLDDILNYSIKEILNNSLESDAAQVKNKFEAVGKIRNELYPLLVTNHALPSLYANDGIPVAEFPSNLRQLIRLSGSFHKIDETVVTDTIDGTTVVGGKTKVEATGDFANVSKGDIFSCGSRYYIIDSVPDDDFVVLECTAHSDVTTGAAFNVYTAETHYIDSIDYVTRNEYDTKIKNDPFTIPTFSTYPKKIYYYMDDYGLKIAFGGLDYKTGVMYIDYVKEPTLVQGGVLYGPEEEAGATLPAIANQDYIAVVETGFGGAGSIQPNVEFTASSGTISYGVVAYDFTNCDLPVSLHEEIVKKATILIGSVPNRDELMKIIANSIY